MRNQTMDWENVATSPVAGHYQASNTVSAVVSLWGLVVVHVAVWHDHDQSKWVAVTLCDKIITINNSFHKNSRDQYV